MAEIQAAIERNAADNRDPSKLAKSAEETRKMLLDEVRSTSLIELLASLDRNENVRVYTNGKKCIDISRRAEKADLFDCPPPLQNFWELLLCRGGSLVGEVNVAIARGGQVPPSDHHFYWYPRSLVKMLLLVSAI